MLEDEVELSKWNPDVVFPSLRSPWHSLDIKLIEERDELLHRIIEVSKTPSRESSRQTPSTKATAIEQSQDSTAGEDELPPCVDPTPPSTQAEIEKMLLVDKLMDLKAKGVKCNNIDWYIYQKAD